MFSFGRQKQVEFCEFKASPAWSAQPVPGQSELHGEILQLVINTETHNSVQS